MGEKKGGRRNTSSGDGGKSETKRKAGRECEEHTQVQRTPGHITTVTKALNFNPSCPRYRGHLSDPLYLPRQHTSHPRGLSFRHLIPAPEITLQLPGDIRVWRRLEVKPDCCGSHAASAAST